MIEKKNISVNERQRALIVTLLASVLVFALWNWNAPQAQWLLRPLRLFVTYVHEAGHSLAAVLTGGEIVKFLVSPDGSGLAYTAGGNRAIIISFGYLGAALFGSLLFLLANRFSRYDNILAIALGIFMIGFTVMFARPDESGAWTAIIIGIIFGVVLLLIGAFAPRSVTLLTLNVLAIITALNAVMDIRYLLRSIDASRGTLSNDAVSFSEQVLGGVVPPTLVAFIWLLIALGMFIVALWFGVWKPLRQEIAYARS